MTNNPTQTVNTAQTTPTSESIPQALVDKTSLWQINVNGWCEQVQHKVSPNFSERPDRKDISLLVIHNISLPIGQFDGDLISDLFQNRLNCDAHPSFHSLRDLQVSSHFLIRRDGSVIQFVSTLDKAWHAGISHFLGRKACNDFSIGIELEGCDFLPYEHAQYASLSLLSSSLIASFPIKHIAGHNEIAPDRKTDPGPHFDWLRFEQDLKSQKAI